MFLRHRMGKFINFVRKLSQTKTTSCGRKNTKACFHLKSILGKEIFSDGFLTNILCRKRVDKNETLVRKLHEVRESFESSRKAIAEEKGGINLNKMARARFR